MNNIKRLLFLSLTLTFNIEGYAQNYSAKKKLQLMKHFMIQGQTDRAKIVSFDLDQDNDYSKDIHYRYKAVLSFIDGHYEKSLEYLSVIPKNIESEVQLCQLEILNHLFLQNKQALERKWPSCYQTSISKSKNNLLWLNSLVSISTKNVPELTKIPFKNIFIDNQNGDFLNLYLKLALYLNREEIIMSRIDKIADIQFDDLKTRELIAMLFFRKNKLLQAYELIKNLETPTALNMLAGFFMAQGKKRLAYGKYKLALEKKNTSLNSLERIIPLSIELEEYRSSEKYIKMYNKLERPSEELLVLEAYLAYENKNYESSSRILRKIIKEKLNTQGLYINRLITLNALALEREELYRQIILKSCIQNSYINCNLLAFSSHFDEPTKVLNQTEQDTKILNEDISSLYMKDIDIEPIDDMIIVKQRDIEELEDRKLELTK